MLLRTVALLVLLLPTLAACGSNGTANRAETIKTTTTKATKAPKRSGGHAGVVPRAALLTLDDMPTGYSAGEDSSSSNTPLKGCPQLEALAADKTQSVAKAEAKFQAGKLGPFIDHQVEVTAKGKAQVQFARLRSALDAAGCQTFTQPAEGGAIANFKLGPLSVPRLGDETFALRVTGDKAAFSITLDLVAERIGDSVSLLVVASVPVLGGPPPALDPLARRADKKLRAA